MIRYTHSLEGIEAEDLQGFHQDWAAPPAPDQLLCMMQASTAVVLALDEERVIGYATGLSDGVLFSFLSSLEVLPEYRHRGVGTELVRRILQLFESLYAFDVVCDLDLAPFYARLGLTPLTAMAIRRPPPNH